MNKLIKRMWQNRNYTGEWLRGINTCPHKLPSHIPEICEVLKKYHDSQQQIVLWTDVDVDGIMAGVIGYAGLKELGFNVGLYLPDTEMYGITPSAVNDMMASFRDARCILTGDIGANDYEGVSYAVKGGLHVLITDRVKPESDNLPDADVYVNPVCDKGKEYFDQYCGAHVMYLVLRSYVRLYEGDRSDKVEQIERLKVFAGIGTLSDNVPLWYENRVMASDAVSIARQIFHDGNSRVVENISGCQAYRNAFWGLFVLLQKFAGKNKIYDSDSIYEDFFSYYVAPAFNSIKRMHRKVEMAYSVFFKGAAEAGKAMDEILNLNDMRKRVVNEEWDKIITSKSRQPWAPYIYVTDANVGMQGLLAQKMEAETGEPAIIVSENKEGGYSGFGRSPVWFPFLQETAGLDCVNSEGHEESFSVKFDGRNSCQELYGFLIHKVKREKPEFSDDKVKPDFKISTCSADADSDIDIELIEDFLYEIESYRPFGNGFAKPVAELEFCPQKVEWSYLGREHKHIKAVFPEGLELVCFNQASFFPYGIEKFRMPKVLRALGEFKINVFNGRRTLRFEGTLES